MSSRITAGTKSNKEFGGPGQRARPGAAGAAKWATVCAVCEVEVPSISEVDDLSRTKKFIAKGERHLYGPL
ncbi:hypothetical protein J6590_029984 [Homalodisca vitripennis]|nr:hypothetical protein J6590_029984 [Homalodisca vitripennis]